ncbi:MAG: VWA domain-containing protein [Planctomycetota bacterium]|nr:MAG: VWA domain-containing protein [Planctomycetota bacterium]
MKKVVFLFLFSAVSLFPFHLLAGSFSKYKKDFLRAVKAKNVEGAAAAIRGMASENSKDAVKYILKFALLSDQLSSYGFTDGNILELNKAAQEALRGISDSQALDYMISQAHRHRDYRVRIILIEVLKEKSGEKFEKGLAECLKDRRQEVLLAAIEAVKAKRSKYAVPYLIDLVGKLQRKEGLVWIEARRALLAITGQDFDNTKDWKKWWSTVKNNFNPNEHSTVGAGRTMVRKKKRVPKLFGTEVVSKRVVFILDISGSMMVKDPESGEGGGTVMRQPGKPVNQQNIPESRRRITRAKNELIKVIKMLDRDVKFNIIAFSSGIKKWKDKYLYPASPANKASAIRWVEGLKANGTTWTDLALKEGFKIKEANTMYLLSDGSPTHDGQTMLPTGPICEMVKNLNKYRRVRIYTLGFRGANVPFMQRLADENYGKYKDIK